MNLSWVSLLGGGVATAVTLAAGVNLTGLAHAFDPAPTPEPTTVYVEQPIVEVPGSSLGAGEELPPLVIAVLPALPQSGGAQTSSIPGGSTAGSGDAIVPPPPAGDDGVYAGDDDDGASDEDYEGGESEGGESEGGEGSDD